MIWRKSMKVLKKLSEIVEGYTNLVFENPEIEALAEKRLNECLPCDERSDKENSPTEIKAFSFCKKCGCNLLAKTRANVNEQWGDGGCPLKKW